MRNETLNPLLIRKYNEPVPRYTSYPTVPFWNEEIDKKKWQRSFADQFDLQNHANGISIYVHLPFCESLCTYCGCNKKITSNHNTEDEYISALTAEWALYRKLMTQTPIIREIHLGGGTPTFFSPQNLQKLIAMLVNSSVIHPSHEFSFEGHPNNTTKKHLETLFSAGFRRVSYGVQDNNPDVQHIINRIQPLENVQRVTELARTVGFTSVNFDLIYGLPLQTVDSIESTFRQVTHLKPDRIAFYSYAHVPWVSKGQRLFNESHLPAPEKKMQLYLKGQQILAANAYRDIGMDHFALPNDDLYQSKSDGRLHRNFMGYTTQSSGLLLGLGMSAISDLGNAFAQNNKTLHNYYASVKRGEPAVNKGYFLTDEDVAFRRYILDVACKETTNFNTSHLRLLEQYTFPKLNTLAADGLVDYNKKQLRVTPEGHYFLRNICSAFDIHMQRRNAPDNKATFSRAI